MINPSLSIVIAGPIRSRVNEIDAITNIRSYKKISPDMEIILSTYEGEVYDSLTSEVNLIVYCKDPGLDSYQKWSTISRNTTRMLVTGSEGLKFAKKQLAIKTRIEINVDNVELLRETIIEVFIPEKDNNNIYLVTTGPFYEEPKEYYMQPYYIFDIFQIGKTSDLLKGWQNALEWFQDNKAQNIFQNLCNPVVPANEQILGFGFMRSIHPNLQMKGPINRYLILFRERYLIERFFKCQWLVIPDEYLGLTSGRLNSYDFSNLSTIAKYQKYLKMRTKKRGQWTQIPFVKILKMQSKTRNKFIQIFVSWYIKKVLDKMRISS